MNNENQLAIRTRYNIFARLFSSLTLLFVNAYASRTFGAEAYGGAQYLLWGVQTVWLFGNLGLPQTCSRFLAAHTVPFSGMLFTKKTTIIFAIVLLVLALTSSIIFFPDRFFLSSILFTALSLQWLLQSIAEGLMLNHLHFRAIIWSSLVMTIVFLALRSTTGIESYFAALIINGLVYSAILIAGFLKHRPESHETTETLPLKQIVTFALSVWIAAIISAFVWQRMEIFFIERSLTKTDVGYFSAAITLATLAMQPIQMLSSALTPYFSKAYSLGDEQAKQTYTFLTKIFAWAAFFTAAAVSFNSEFVITFIYGESFRPASYLLAILGAAAPLSAVASVGSSLLSAHAKMPFVAATSAVLAVVSIIAYAMIIPAHGLFGGAIVRTILQGAGIIAGTYYIHHRLHFIFPLKEYLFSAVSAFTIFFIMSIIALPHTFPFVAVKVITAAIIYGSVTYSYGYYSNQEVTKLKKIFGTFTSPFGT